MPILAPHTLEVISRSPEQTRRAGMRLGTLLRLGDVVCLVGDLGAGKTTLVQGIAVGWGTLDQISSPTFVLVNVYRRINGGRLFHLDAYRLNSAREAEDLDLDSFLQQGPLLVEWADRIEAALQFDCLRISLSMVGENQRDLLFEARGPRYQELLSAFRKHVYGG